jgi:hypothetical protein
VGNDKGETEPIYYLSFFSSFPAFFSNGSRSGTLAALLINLSVPRGLPVGGKGEISVFLLTYDGYPHNSQ